MEPLINSQSFLKTIPQFQIDDQGIFKYIRIDCTDETSKQICYYIRGKRACQYHKENFEQFLNELRGSGCTVIQVKRDKQDTLWSFKVKIESRMLSFKCLGGGRMVHSTKNKSLEIYGYSITYSKGHKIKHDITLEIAKKSLGYPSENIFISKKSY